MPPTIYLRKKQHPVIEVEIIDAMLSNNPQKTHFRVKNKPTPGPLGDIFLVRKYSPLRISEAPIDETYGTSREDALVQAKIAARKFVSTYVSEQQPSRQFTIFDSLDTVFYDIPQPQEPLHPGSSESDHSEHPDSRNLG